jgi:hypothetical protein
VKLETSTLVGVATDLNVDELAFSLFYIKLRDIFPSDSLKELPVPIKLVFFVRSTDRRLARLSVLPVEVYELPLSRDILVFEFGKELPDDAAYHTLQSFYSI